MINNSLADAAKALRDKAQAICEAGAEAHAAEMKRLLEFSGAGAQYGDLPSESSGLGEASVSQESGLSDSIQVVPLNDDSIGAATVVSGVAVYLELGTSKMSPRPFAEQALQAAEEAMSAEAGK